MNNMSELHYTNLRGGNENVVELNTIKHLLRLLCIFVFLLIIIKLTKTPEIRYVIGLIALYLLNFL